MAHEETLERIFSTCQTLNPNLELWGEDVVRNLRKVVKDCTKEEGLLGRVFGLRLLKRVFDLDRGTRTLRRLNGTEDYPDCCYRPFYRLNDDDVPKTRCES
jgi:hypothetical protein